MALKRCKRRESDEKATATGEALERSSHPSHLPLSHGHVPQPCVHAGVPDGDVRPAGAPALLARQSGAAAKQSEAE